MLTGPPPKFHGTRDILQRYRAATLAAIWSAIFSAESAGLALHVVDVDNDIGF
jgi:hypothetical protein